MKSASERENVNEEREREGKRECERLRKGGLVRPTHRRCCGAVVASRVAVAVPFLCCGCFGGGWCCGRGVASISRGALGCRYISYMRVGDIYPI